MCVVAPPFATKVYIEFLYSCIQCVSFSTFFIFTMITHFVLCKLRITKKTEHVDVLRLIFRLLGSI
jgi:hypothetical protein